MAKKSSQVSAESKTKSKPKSKPETKTARGSSPVPFRVIKQYLQDFSFENHGAMIFQSRFAKQSHPHYNANWHISNTAIEPQSGDAKIQTANFYNAEVRFTLSAHYDDSKDSDKKLACFMLEISMVAIIEVAVNIPDKEAHQRILRIDVPRLLYPYLRFEIDKTLQSGGYPPMQVPPLNFVAAYQQFMQQSETDKP